MSFLSSSFVETFRKRTPFWGFPSGPNWLGEITFRRTYARNGETWADTVQRVVEGTFEILESHCKYHTIPFDYTIARRDAQEMYERIWEFKFTPPGRGLWVMGTDFVRNRTGAPLFNCSFISTQDIEQDVAYPFCFLMDMSMLGVGVGFDTRGAEKVVWSLAKTTTYPHVISDDREGWVESLRALLVWAFEGGEKPEFNYEYIRKENEPIRGFGGVSSGPEPLRVLHQRLFDLAHWRTERPISSRDIADIGNMIGCCVVAGNVRRTAEIILGDPNDSDFLNLKNYTEFPYRSEWGWASNNTINASVGMDYTEPARRTAQNGEPGYFWPENVKAFGRMCEPPNHKDHRALGTNPCVPGWTEILTDVGYRPIEELVGKVVNVWNGFEWSSVTPRVTGLNQPLVKVSLSSGQTLTCTTAHRFVVVDGYGSNQTQVKIPAEQLLEGMKLLKAEYPVIEGGVSVPQAYVQGFISAEGMDGYKYFYVYNDKKPCVPFMAPHATKLGEDCNQYYSRWRVRADFDPLPKSFVPFSWDLKSRLAWFAGLLDGDGTVLKEGGTQISSVDLDFLLRTQKMLTTLGVASKVTQSTEAQNKWLPDGHGGKCQYPCKASYRLLLGTVAMQHLLDIGLQCHRLKFSNPFPNRDASRFVTVVSVEEAGFADTVYCFTEPLRNLGCFEGVVTGQCGEQTLESGECCCLVENFIGHHQTLEDFRKTLKYAYLYAKAVTLKGTHWPKTNAIMLRNRRIGTSLSGVVQFLHTHGRRKLLRWCEEGYQTIQHYDQAYSEWLCIRPSIKTTSIKPSGTVSLLAGVTPGAHYPTYRHYLRRMRFGKNHPDLEPIRQAGYRVEPDVRDPDTMVVEFPVKGPDVPTEQEVSIEEKLDLAVTLQHHWADNQVSVTVTFDPETEGFKIPYLLKKNDRKLKSVSFLPISKDFLPYPQMPYEPISAEEYERRIRDLKPISWLATVNSQDQLDRFCDGATCSIS